MSQQEHLAQRKTQLSNELNQLIQFKSSLMGNKANIEEQIKEIEAREAKVVGKLEFIEEMVMEPGRISNQPPSDKANSEVKEAKKEGPDKGKTEGQAEGEK